MAGKRSKMRVDLGKIEGIQRNLEKGYVARVGILQDREHSAPPGQQGISMVELGMIHEFGSVTKNIPPRSFLLMPLEEKKKELVQFLTSKEMKKAIEAGNIMKAFTLLGFKGQEIVQQAFNSGGFGKWTPLKESTIKRKGSDKILIDTSELRRSILSDVVKK